MHTDTNKTAPKSSEREERVFAAALDVFTRYGFQRTTMDDIARAAQMSRPALYLHFKNKRDIYRALAARMTLDMTASLQRLLDRPGPTHSVLLSAFDTAIIEPLARIAATPHGMELIDMKSDLAEDIMVAMRSRKRAMLSAFFARRMADAANSGPLADMLIDAFEGAKARAKSVDELRAAMRSTTGFVADIAESSGER
jgi:AcrR family transcriptional regulator